MNWRKTQRFEAGPATSGGGLLPVEAARMAMMGLGVILAILLMAQGLVHLGTGHHINHISGAWIALAQYADNGTLYPPLYDGAHYAGTRYMAIPVLLHTAVSQVTGEYVMSGKLVGLLACILLAVLMMTVMIRHVKCPAGPALLMVTIVLALPVGYSALASIRGDEYGVLWQVAALACIAIGRPRSVWVVAAAVFSILGIFSKITAIWAPAAIAMWLLWYEPRMARLFMGLCVAGGLAMLGGLHIVTEGRMIATFVHLSLAGVQDEQMLLLSPIRLMWKMLTPANGLVLVPLAGWAVIMSLMERRISLYGLALLCCVPVMVFVMADEGANDNHLLDLIVLCGILSGEAWKRVIDGSSGGRLEWMLAAVLAFAGASVLSHDMYLRVRDTAGYLRGHNDEPDRRLRPVEGVIEPGEHVLSDDPYVPVSLGQRPVVMDAWMLLRLEEAHPEWLQDLADRLEGREFDALVVMRSLEDDPQWFQEVVFGPTVYAAMREHYALTEQVDRYWVYRPAE